MRELDRDRFTFFDLAMLPHSHIRGHLDGTAVDIEEPESVATTHRLQGSRLPHQLHTAYSETLGQTVDTRGVGHSIGHQVEALVGVLANAHDVVLGRALGREIRYVTVGSDVGQTPLSGVEVELLLVVGYSEIDMAEMGESVVAHDWTPDDAVDRPSRKALSPSMERVAASVRPAARTWDTGSVMPMSNG